MYSPAIPARDVTDTVSLLGSGDFAPLERAPGSTSANVAADPSRFTVTKREGGPPGTSAGDPLASGGVTAEGGDVSAPDVQRVSLAQSSSPTLGASLPSRGGQSASSVPSGLSHPIDSPNLSFHASPGPAPAPADGAKAVEPEPAGGQNAARASSAVNGLTVGREAASLVGGQPPELVVARSSWAPASPVTADNRVHFRGAIEVQRDGSLSAPGSPLIQDVASPQMPFWPGH